MSPEIKSKILQLVSEYDAGQVESPLNDITELSTLIDSFGIEAVSLASGLKISSILAITRPCNIKSGQLKVSEKALKRAKVILSKI